MKHSMGQSKSDVHHTRIVLKPQNIIPEFDIKVGEDK